MSAFSFFERLCPAEAKGKRASSSWPCVRGLLDHSDRRVADDGQRRMHADAFVRITNDLVCAGGEPCVDHECVRLSLDDEIIAHRQRSEFRSLRRFLDM